MPDMRSSQSIPVIDVHAHCMPLLPFPVRKAMEFFMARHGSLRSTTHKGITSVIYPELTDLDLQIPVLEEAGVSKSILSFSMELELICEKSAVLPRGPVMKMFNDAMAETVALHPDRLDFMAAVDPFHRGAVRECRRAIEDLGARGISIGSSFMGRFPDSKKTEALWEFAADKKAPVFIHPPFAPMGRKQAACYRLEEALARPFDTTLSIARLIYSGVFDRHPDLSVIVIHGGSALLGLLDRLDFTQRLGYEGLPEGQEAVCRRKPSDYVRTNLYADTMGFSAAKLGLCLEVFGTDRVVFGSDYAAVNISPREQLDIIKGLELDEEDLEKVLWKNASGLFGYS